MPAFQRRLCCGCSTSAIMFVMGGVALVYASIDMADYKDPTCGLKGKPPLRDWLFGAGISFIAIAASYGAASKGTAGGCCGFIAAISNLFLLCWAIVGSVSLWRDGKDCETIDIALWRVSYATVIINWIVVLFGVVVVFESKDDMMQAGGQGENDENV